jgi:hypothetical protein
MANDSTENRLNVRLTEKQKAAFHKVLKIAVYKELHRKNKISTEQLSKLIKMQNG